MGEMPHNWPPEFAKRAAENLDLVLNSNKNDVTQTVLTLYSLVVVPVEKKLFLQLGDSTKDQMLLDGWRVETWSWLCKRKDVGDPHGFQAFLRLLRNALAHGHIKFVNAGSKVSGIRFDHNYRGSHIFGEWSAEVAVQSCRKLLRIIQSCG